MDTTKLKKFAQNARRQLIDQVTIKLSHVLEDGSAARRENSEAVKELESQINASTREQVIEKVAYTWFNRFCALRFMDANHYTSIGAVSPPEGFTQPEILAEAKQHHIDGSLDSFIDRDVVFDLLEGRTPSGDPQQEAYRLLLVAVCNYYNSVMPFLFERITDYTELLMPDDLISDSSILAEVRVAMTVEACKDVEVIGWLYQFYISEKKDDVFAALKKGKKIAAENIPAATQLFTPNWIVRYLVENSLGRLWMLNKPGSTLAQSMDYYIKPETPETDFLKISSPEEIKICDPACGSGHMLVYAFDLLYRIYEEEGYDAPDIPRLILRNNLYGIEIDERAGMLTYFALVMKAREKYSRFLKKSVQPHVCVLENVKFEKGEIKTYMDEVGHDLFTMNLQATLRQFEETDNFGSLIKPLETDVESVRNLLEEKGIGNDLFLRNIHLKVLQAIKQADYLSPKYHVVVANPPYMGSRNMNKRLQSFAKDNYQESKTDLFAMFIERSLDFAMEQTLIAMITMQSWMFLTSYSKLRKKLINNTTLLQLYHTGPGLFPELGSFNVLTASHITKVSINNSNYKTCFIKANDTPSHDDKLRALSDHDSHILLSVNDLASVPDFPLVYWLSASALINFKRLTLLKDVCPPRAGLQTGDNGQFVRRWHEVNLDSIGLSINTSVQAKSSGKKWFPYNKGGNYRKWYGNNEFVVNWRNAGEDIHRFANIPMDYSGAPVRAKRYYFREGIVYSLFGFENIGVRYKSNGFIFDVSGSSIFPDKDLEITLAFLCSNVAFYYLRALAPTVNFQVGDLARLPLPRLAQENRNVVIELAKDNIAICKADWDMAETSWDFQATSLSNKTSTRYEKACKQYIQKCEHQKNSLRKNEEIINQIMVKSYGVEDEVEASVSDRDLTIKVKNNDEIIKEYISYAVGCMFGRYSIDKPGLILANQGETYDDFLKAVPNPTFEPDDDNVLPLMDVEWFTDDIADRFKEFLKVTFGDEHYEDNLRFIEEAIDKDIRKYFLKDFYSDHIKRYKKRPIYWMFSSPKGSFNALIYMHRYRPDTVSVVLNDYLREFRTKLVARREHLEGVSISESTSKTEKTKALKEIESLKKVIVELEEYERNILYPMATQKIEIDLDDGVKVNYNKFGKALKKIPGLSE